jgi:hypothetical protein
MGSNICQECGMLVVDGEYHPFAACLIFKGCSDGGQVRNILTCLDQYYTGNERERCANICEEMALESDPDDFALDALNYASVKIRSGE